MARILVIEDNPANYKFARLILTSAGHEVIGAEHAGQGIRLARDRAPDLIDIQLPSIDGLTATRVLKSEPDTAKVPVIAVTAFAMAGGRGKSAYRRLRRLSG